MEAHELLAQARETYGVRREYGEPYVHDGVTVIPVSAVRGGGGAGSDHEGDGGGGFGLTARPTGAWVIKGDQVTWKPAVDPMRVLLGAEILAGLALVRTSRTAGRRRVPRVVVRGHKRHVPRVVRGHKRHVPRPRLPRR